MNTGNSIDIDFGTVGEMPKRNSECYQMNDNIRHIEFQQRFYDNSKAPVYN